MTIKKDFQLLFLMSLILLSTFTQVNLITTIYAIENPKVENTPSTANFNLRKIGQFTDANKIVDVEIVGTLALLADESQGLLVVNISDYHVITLLDSYKDDTNSVYDIIVQGQLAFLAHGQSGIKIIDFSDPENIIEVGGFNDGGLAWKVFLKENYLFVVDRLHGIEILNATNKNNLIKIGLYEGQPYDIFVRDDLAFIAAGINKGLEIVDISDLSSPKKIGETEVFFEDTIGLFVQDDFVFTANKEKGMKIINVNRVRHPKVVAEYNVEEGSKIWAIEVDNGFAYLASEAKGVLILDITDKLNPYRIGQYFNENSGKTFNLAVVNDLIYLASFDAGLEVITWRIGKPIPTANDYKIIDSAILNFNKSVGPFAIDALLGNETLGLDLHLYLDLGLLSPINITVEAPSKINPGDLLNLIIAINGESSYFWGRFEGTIAFRTPIWSSELFSLEDVGIPEHIKLNAFHTFIGENITMKDAIYPITLWSQELLNYSLSLVMIPTFTVTGSAIVTAKINNSVNLYELDWIQDNDRVIVPIKIPEEAEKIYAIPLENLQFNIDELLLDLNKIRFDLLLYDLIPIYSWEINISNFDLEPSLKENLVLWVPNQINNNTLFFLDGIFPLGDFLIVLNFTGKIQLPTWAVLLTLLGIITLIILPFALIIISSRKKNRETSLQTGSEN
ncbi:MAG: hypothetical protein JXA54_17290 [Candidatus Heimdallarchaeota archaeon]|nr:hypothetical protein [Candidatus Heimdallarchaeota archaeon]